MMQPEKKDPVCKRELARKLASFRMKLGEAIGRKRLNQGTFGEMYGGYSGRTIASYELGDVDPPASLLYSLWKTGHSIDALFGEGNISDTGRDAARELYAQSTSEFVRAMDESRLDKTQRLLDEKEITNAKKTQHKPTNETTPTTSGKGKASAGAAGKSKKR
jgi:hypothetical protein